MHLVYLDESGNSGLNLNDPQQPVFVLCAMVVDEKRWQSLEQALKKVLDERVTDWKAREKFEVHAVDLRRGMGHFAGVSVSDRIAFRDAWMGVGAEHGVRLSYRSVFKKNYADWLVRTFGQGVLINPHVVAFPLLSRCVDNYLRSLPDKPLGMLISDENKEISLDIEKSIKVLRDEVGSLRLGQIVEKGFFIDSMKSFPLQLCDLFAYSFRKSRERGRISAPPKSIDDSGITMAEDLLYENEEHDMDVLAWLTKQHAPAAPRPASPMPRG